MRFRRRPRLRHLEVLRGQPRLLGAVASVATATRTLAALGDTDIDASVERLDAARAQVRLAAWSAGAAPAPVTAPADGDEDGGLLCIDLDATLVTAHSDDKDGADKTYKRPWGVPPDDRVGRPRRRHRGSVGG